MTKGVDTSLTTHVFHSYRSRTLYETCTRYTANKLHALATNSNSKLRLRDSNRLL